MASGDTRFITSMKLHARIVSGDGNAGTKAHERDITIRSREAGLMNCSRLR